MPRGAGRRRRAGRRADARLAEELEQLAPFGRATRRVSLLVPGGAARRPARDGGGPPRRVHAHRGRRPLALRALRRRQPRCRPSPASRSTPPSGSRSTAATARSSRGSCCASADPAPARAIEVLGEPALRRRLRAPSWPRPGALGAASRRRAAPARRPPSTCATVRGTGIAGAARGPRRHRRAACSPSPRTRRTARGAARPRRRLRALLLGRARGRSRPGRRLRPRRRRRPAAHAHCARCSTIRPARAGPTWRGVSLS